MFDLNLIGRGVLLGFAIAAPVGPIGLLCIQRSLSGGFRQGLATGLGAATADAIYGAVAALGLQSVSVALVAMDQPLRVLGGAFLLYLGVSTIRAKYTPSPARGKSPGLGGAYLSTVALTLANPMTILSFAAAFGSLGTSLAAQGSLLLVFVAAVFVGSAFWWVFLSAAAGALRVTFSHRWLHRINILSGLLLAGLGCAALASVWRR